jgi:peptide/nickel transport system substrate-binding protein
MGAPRVRLDVRIVPDPGTNFTLLQSGGLDWNLVSPAQRASLGAAPALAFRTVPLTLIAGIAVNTAHPPLDDVRVRRAIAASIDRDAISRKITFGRYPVVDTAQPLGSWARDASVREPAFAPAEADRLLDAAGWKRGPGGVRAKNGQPLALTYVQFPESQTGVRVATFAQSELNARGFNVTIKSLSNAQLFLPKAQGGTLATGAFDLAYVPWPMGADPDDSFLLTCAGTSNVMRWCDPTVDGLERRALTAPSHDERKRLYAQIESRVAAAVPIVYLFNPSYSYAYRARLAGFSPNAFNPTWNAYQWSVAP